MKPHYLLILIVSCFLSDACTKNDNTLTPAGDFTAIVNARAFYDQQFRSSANLSQLRSAWPPANPRNPHNGKPLWNRTETRHLSVGQALVVPFRYDNPFFINTNLHSDGLYLIDDITWLVFYRDSFGKYHGEVVTCFPDSNYSQLTTDKFSGIITVENFDGKLLARFRYGKGGDVRRSLLENQVVSNAGTSHEVLSFTQPAGITVCYQMSGYNYVPTDPQGGYYWTESLGCQSLYYEDSNPYGVTGVTNGHDYANVPDGGGSGNKAPANRIPSTPKNEVVAGDNIIGNIRDYNKCFKNIPGNQYSYEVTVCVSQPTPGTRKTWGFSGSGSSSGTTPVNVGHAFLVLKQSTPLTSTVRNAGFYPQSGVSPIDPIDNGQLNNDASRTYNIALTITMTNSQFFTVLEYLNNSSDLMYDLNRNNCTSFVLNALASAGYNLPRTVGTWPNGSGLNPGDLGEDVRRMPLSANMTRRTSYSSHPNRGTCY